MIIENSDYCYFQDRKQLRYCHPGTEPMIQWQRVGSLSWLSIERFSATKLGTVFGTVYRRKHSKNAEVLRLSH